MATATFGGVAGFLPAGQKTQPNNSNLHKYILLVLAVCIFLPARLVAEPSSATFSIAPVSPAFAKWQAKGGPVLAASRDGQSHALGFIPSPVDRSHLLIPKIRATSMLPAYLPTSYDLRTLGYVTAVKDQGSCGSCWTFASYGSSESCLLKDAAETWDFSENHMKNYHGFDWGPCDGGNADMSTAYLVRWSGPVNEADDPYHDWDDRPSPGGPSQKCVENVLWFFTPDDIKNALMTYGGMHIVMYWNSAYYNSSQNTYYYDGSEYSNHAVTLAGWDDNKVVSGAPGNGAWLLKNSWGSDWGDDGYFWISYYDSVAVQYAAAFCNAVPASSYSANYQYDPLGLIGSVGYDSTTAWAANIFTATADEQLTAVGLYAVDYAVSYTIYVYDHFNSGTFSGLLGSVSGTLAEPGYHTIALTSPIDLTTGNDFSIVVKFITSGYHYPIPVETDIVDYSSAATAGPGQSYVSPSGGAGTFEDITNYSGFENTNVCIKGLTIEITRACDPSPVDGATGVDITTVLSWTAGIGATSHDVYFGSTSPGTFQGNQTETTFDPPGTLLPNTTYYWRIDELGPSGGKKTGTVWRFTTGEAVALPWSDDFESSSFTAGGWTVAGSMPLPSVTTTAKYTGAYGARILRNNTGTKSITKNKSTVGYDSIHFKYDRRATYTNVTLYVQWSADGGSTWTTLEAVSGFLGTTWESKDWALGTDADNNPNFRIRFCTPAGYSNRYAYIDNVQITGMVSPHISGTVTCCGAGLADVTMNGLPSNPITDSNGNYSDTVSYGWDGTVTPTKTGYTFEPNMMSYVDVIADEPNQNYAAYDIYDLDYDCCIGWGDVAVIHDNWLQTGEDLLGDFYQDEADTVNFCDLAKFAERWNR